MFTFGEFSIFSGWGLFREAIDDDAEFLSKGRGFLAGILIAVIPFLIFFCSITYGFTSYGRIKNPKKVIDEEYD